VVPCDTKTELFNTICTILVTYSEEYTPAFADAAAMTSRDRMKSRLMADARNATKQTEPVRAVDLP
jgi:hypothetical protein